MPNANYYQNLTAPLWGIMASLVAVATIAVLLRLFSRRLSQAPFWWDDWTVVAALVTSIFNLHIDFFQRILDSFTNMKDMEILYYGLTTCYWIQVGAGGLGRHTEAVGGPVDQRNLLIYWKARFLLAHQIPYPICSDLKMRH